MLNVYLNYPNPRVTVHRNERCSSIQKHQKPGQRVVRLDVACLSVELKKFEEQHYMFAADAANNDMWLEVDFGDAEFERAVVQYVKNVLAAHYTPFGPVTITPHC